MANTAGARIAREGKLSAQDAPKRGRGVLHSGEKQARQRWQPSWAEGPLFKLQDSAAKARVCSGAGRVGTGRSAVKEQQPSGMEVRQAGGAGRERLHGPR